MLRSTTHVHGYRIAGKDDDLGKVGDFLFDDRVWSVRYVVVDTGKWLPGRKVLVAPAALGTPDWESRTVTADLTREQVEHGPPLARNQPVSRRNEIDLHAHYGWGPYWMAGAEPTAVAAAAVADPGPASAVDEDGDPHLRSTQEVVGYHIKATDGEIGHVEDLIVETDTWILRYLVVDTRNWLPGRKVLVSPEWAGEIDWARRTVAVDLTRDQIKSAPEYDPSMPVNRSYETRLYDVLGRPYYWS